MGQAKIQCAFYDEKRHNCKALNALFCEKEEKLCSFFKTKEQFAEDQKRDEERKARLEGVKV